MCHKISPLPVLAKKATSKFKKLAKFSTFSSNIIRKVIPEVVRLLASVEVTFWTDTFLGV